MSCHRIWWVNVTYSIYSTLNWLCEHIESFFIHRTHNGRSVCVCVSAIIYMSCGPRYHQLVLHSKWYKFNLNKLIVNTMMKIHFLFSLFFLIFKYGVELLMMLLLLLLWCIEKKNASIYSYIHWSKWFDATFWHLFSYLYRFGQRLFWPTRPIFTNFECAVKKHSTQHTHTHKHDWRIEKMNRKHIGGKISRLFIHK